MKIQATFSILVAVVIGSFFAVTVAKSAWAQPIGPVRDLSDQIDQALTIITPKRAFVTSTLYDGNLAGLEGADEKCQSAADSAGLPGTFQPGKSIRRHALDRSLNPHGIIFSRQYDSVLHFFRKSLVNPKLFAIITPPNGLFGFYENERKNGPLWRVRRGVQPDASSSPTRRLRSASSSAPRRVQRIMPSRSISTL
jgi:hypothetical protein